MNKREFITAYVLARAAHVERFDGVRCASAASDAYDAIVAASADEGWIEHRGEKPYPEGMVEVRFRDGGVMTFNSDELIWTHDDAASDIVAWRPAT